MLSRFWRTLLRDWKSAWRLCVCKTSAARMSCASQWRTWSKSENPTQLASREPTESATLNPPQLNASYFFHARSFKGWSCCKTRIMSDWAGTTGLSAVGLEPTRSYLQWILSPPPQPLGQTDCWQGSTTRCRQDNMLAIWRIRATATRAACKASMN